MAATLASRPGPESCAKLSLLGRNAIPAVLLLLEAVSADALEPRLREAIDRLRALSTGLVDAALPGADGETGRLGEVMHAIEVIRSFIA